MRVHVKVTKKDIEDTLLLDGNHDEYSCPISRGLRRVVRKGFTVFTSRDYVAIEDESTKDVIESRDLPKQAKKFVETIDNTALDAKPFSFRLYIPKKYLKPKYRKAAA